MSERPIFTGGGADATDGDAREARAVAATVERIDAPSSLEPDTRQALFALLSSLADNKYVLGRRYAEWCTGAPMLESAVAAAAMAQDELGHARSFYPLLRGFPEASETVSMEEEGWQNRPTRAVAALDSTFAVWSDLAAANFLIDTALTCMLEAATHSAYEPLRQRARKIVQEEQPHWLHAEGWVRRLAADAAQRRSLAQSLAGMWDDAATWFGPPDDPTLAILRREQIVTAGPADLVERLRSRVSPPLADVGLARDILDRRLPWERWDSAGRRLGARG